MNDTSRTPPTFSEYLIETYGSNWVAARRTKRIVAKYGDDVVCFSQKRFAEIMRGYETRYKKKCY